MNDDNESSGTLHCQRCCWVPFPLPQKHFLKENGNAQTWISWEGGGALLRSGAMIWMLNFYTTLPWAKQSTSAAQDSLHNQLSLSFQICKVLLSQRMTLCAVWCFQPNAGKQGDKRGFEPCRVHLPGAGATASPDECLLLKCCITGSLQRCMLSFINRLQLFLYPYTKLQGKLSELKKLCWPMHLSLPLRPQSFSCPN